MNEILKPLFDWYQSLTAIGQVILVCVLIYVVFRIYYFWANKKLKHTSDDG